MQNKEAARYARWAAAIAVLIAAVAATFYFGRQIRLAHARKNGPKAVPASVEQQSAGFSFSKVEKDRTIYTVQASRATQFTGENSSLLEDVTITFFGNEGDRNDVFRTHECDYDRVSGGIRCQGKVEIDIQAAANPGTGAGNSTKGMAMPRTLVVDTSDVVFNRETGVATTTQPVKFHLPNADGQAVGVNYDSKGGKLRLEREVAMTVRDMKNPAAPPVMFTGAAFDYEREAHLAKLEGGAKVVQANRQLTAQTVTVELDQRMHAKRGVAEGNPVLQVRDEGDTITGRAERFEAALNEAGWVSGLRAVNNVDFEKVSGGATEKLLAQNANVTMEPRINQPREMQATGDVKLETNGPSGSNRVDTSQVNVVFVPGAKPPQRRIGSAEFPTAATAHLNGKDGTMTVLTHRGRAEFDAANHIRSFEGDSGVQIVRQPQTGDVQRTTAQRLNASFDEPGRWDTVDLDQKVHFVQGDRQADARHAQIVSATNTIVLTGNASVADASSRTTAEKFEIQQQSGDVSGTGGVHSQVMNSPQDKHGAKEQEPAFVTADRVDGSSAKGHLTYTGHARLWQGEAVLDANSIELWRGDQRLDAHGNVVAVFPQAPSKESGTPVRWKIQAPEMQYWNIEGRAHLQGGVLAQSQDQALSQSLNSRTLDVYLSPPSTGTSASAKPVRTAKPAPDANAEAKNAFPGLGSREVTRAVATGSVVVRQDDKRGTAEHAEYTAADQKFVLSGGSPTFTDATDQTTTAGRSLTFYRASDTVFVDSENNARTLTKHRVEK
jgi:lipopolysaccharide export system protein LptA